MAWRMPKAIKTELERHGLPWSVEVRKKHNLVRIDGRAALVLPKNDFKEGRKLKNSLMNIRQTVAEIKGV